MNTSSRTNSYTVTRVIAYLLYTLIILAALPAFAVDDTKARIVRVGYMDHPGFITKTENGRFVGYSAEYMEDICQYTGWQVEYVLAPWSEQLEMLERGELDIVGVAQYTKERAEKFLFTSQPIGLVQGMLLTLPKGENDIESSANARNGRTIGIIRGSSNIEVLKEYADALGFSYTLKEYDFQNDLEAALFNKEVDIIAAEQTTNDGKVRVLDRFASSPYYFITSNANPELMNELNGTISKINAYEPTYTAKLYEKHFGSSITGNRPYFTPLEAEFIDSCGEITVAYVPDSNPIVFVTDSGSPEGLLPNIISRVSDLSGIQFSYAYIPYDQTPLDYLNEHPTHIAGGIVSDNPAVQASGALTTEPFYAHYTALAVRSEDADEFNVNTGAYTIGAPTAFQALQIYLKQNHPNLTIVDCVSVEDGLQALEDGDIDCFADLYSVMIPHLSNPRFADIVIADDRFMTASLSAAALDIGDNKTLIGIIDKCISMLTEGEIAGFESEQLMKSLYRFEQKDVLHRYKFLILYSALLIVGLFSLLITLLFLRHRKFNRAITLHAEYDMMTGLYNREALKDKSKRVMTENPDSEYAILILDIDNMKHINETRGHSAGDSAIRAVANVLKEHFRGSALVGRTGGDEFAVVLDNVGTKAILVSAMARLQKTISTLRIADSSTAISVSIGVVIGSAGKGPLDELVRHAEDALYSVKGSGKNGFAFYESKRISVVETFKENNTAYFDKVPSAAPTEEAAESNTADESDYEKLLNVFPNVGIYVIERDTHKVIYYNKRFKELCANIKLGMSCRSLRFVPCKNCIVDTMKERTMAHTVCYSDAFKGEVEITATQFMWKGTIPAVMVSSWPRNLSASTGGRLPVITQTDSFDFITGALTRAGFIRMIERMQKGDIDLTEYAILFINIKNFKAVNEMAGSLGGDNLLRTVFTRIEHSALHPVIGSRNESDHFIFLVEKSNLDYTCLPELFNFHWQYNGKDMFIHCRSGIFLIDDNRLEVYKMIDRAKLAKEHIVDEFVKPHAVYEQFMLDEYSENATASLLLENGIKNNEFAVYYQPVVNAKTGAVVSGEALVRRIKPDGTVVSPEKFIPILERTGYITMLDRFVAQEVNSFLHERMQSGLPVIPISFNLSQKDFYDSDMMELLATSLEKSTLPKGSFMIEITESVYTLNEKKHREYLKRLRSVGAEILLDDFGTGYSSFGMFENYNFDRVKLDISFVRQLVKNEGVRQVVDSLISMFHKLGVQVVAEGVETDEVLNILKGMDCDFVQGYYFSKPIDKDAFNKYLNIHS